MSAPPKSWVAAAVLGCFAITGCSQNERPAKEVPMSIQLSSPAFSEGQPIPEKYTCDGRDVSPPLKWTSPPPNTQSLALVVEDPDAPMGTWIHWVLFNLPPTTVQLPEDTPKSQHLPGGAAQGLNDFRRLGYGGPCPPPGKAHRYFFKLYALDTVLDLKAGATRKELDRAMQNHILAQGQLMGTYQRR